MPATITQIAASRFTYPEGHPEGPGGGELFVYLIRTPEAAVLVDTGIGTGHAGVNEHYKPTPFDLSAALKAEGVELRSISAVVCSHLHFDHCGNNRLFAGVPIYVQRAEHEAAMAQGYTLPEWFSFPGADYRLLDGPLKIDRCIELVPTPGHSPGHQSVAVTTALGLEIIVAQAAYTAAEFERFAQGTAPVRDDAWSLDAYTESLAKLQGLGPVRAYFSHDATVWREPGPAA